MQKTYKDLDWENHATHSFTLKECDNIYKQGKIDAIMHISQSVTDFKHIENMMKEYFQKVDLYTDKTDLERLALKIACDGMQTIGCFVGELEEMLKENSET